MSIVSKYEFERKYPILDEACRQWYAFIQEDPSRADGEGFGQFYEELSSLKYAKDGLSHFPLPQRTGCGVFVRRSVRSCAQPKTFGRGTPRRTPLSSAPFPYGAGGEYRRRDGDGMNGKAKLLAGLLISGGIAALCCLRIKRRKPCGGNP